LPIVGSLRSLIFQKIRGSFARLSCIMLRAICGRISLQEPKFKRCIGITSSRRAPGGKPEDTLPLRCRGFFFGRLNQMAQPQAPDFDRDEVIVCTLIAFCIGNFTLETIYRLFG
jgi:hypothetical protein